jgi:hypothetical protein
MIKGDVGIWGQMKITNGVFLKLATHPKERSAVFFWGGGRGIGVFHSSLAFGRIGYCFFILISLFDTILDSETSISDILRGTTRPAGSNII